jgi:hypothetical protein
MNPSKLSEPKLLFNAQQIVQKYPGYSPVYKLLSVKDIEEFI